MDRKCCVLVLVLFFLTVFTVTDCSTCQTNKLAGGSLSFKLTDRPLRDNDRFGVKKDNKVVVPKRNRIQNGPWNVKNDFLEFQNVQPSDSGSYNVEVFDVNGNQINSYMEIVCVYAKVPKPTVTIACENEKVNISCDVEDKDQRSDLSFSWHKNGNDLKTNASDLLANVEGDRSKYTCTAQNPVDQNTSDPVEAACFKPVVHACFGFWFVVSILTGGGALVLLLVIALVTVSCCAWKLRENLQRAKNFNLTHSYTSLTSVQPEKSTLGPSGIYDNVPFQEVPQAPSHPKPRPRNQKYSLPSPSRMDDEERVAGTYLKIDPIV